MKACSPLMGGRCISDRGAWKRGAGALAFALLCVLAIGLLQRAGLLDGLNVAGMEAAGSWRQGSQLVTLLMQAASMIGGTAGRLLIVGVVLIALLASSKWRDARWLALAMAGGTLLNLGLKQDFAAPRPDLLPHLDIVHSYSFPSGHSAGSMMLFGALALLVGGRAAWLGAGVIIALIGVSRVWLGVHWPSDVLAGWIEGIGWLLFCRHWLPARRGEQECVVQLSKRRHAVRGDEAMDPETVEHDRHGDQ